MLVRQHKTVPHTLLAGLENGAATMRYSVAVPYIAEHTATTCPANLLLGTYTAEMKTMFIMELFVIAKKWEQPRRLSADE